MRCIDESGSIWHSQPFNAKYRWLRQGNYVRIRAATLSAHSSGYERTFGMRHYTNILSLPYPCKLAQDMHFDEINESKAFEAQQLCSKEMLCHPIIVSQIKDEAVAKKKVTAVDQVTGDETHKVRVNVAAIA